MAEPHVIGALRNKRAERAGMLRQLEQQLVQQRANLAHVDATMRLFDPDMRPAQAHEHVLRASLGHPRDLAGAELNGQPRTGGSVAPSGPSRFIEHIWSIFDIPRGVNPAGGCYMMPECLDQTS